MAGQPQQDQQERGALGALQGCHYLLSSLQAVMFPLDQIGKTALLAIDTSDITYPFLGSEIEGLEFGLLESFNLTKSSSCTSTYWYILY